MNKMIRWGFAAGLLPLAACAGNPPPPPTPPAPPPLAAADANFVTMATQGGLAEIAEAQLAEKQSHNPSVLNYAKKMITDHTAANDQLAQIASKKGVTPPATPSDAQTQEANALSSETGRKFDHDYIADQIAGHTMMVQLYQTEASNGADPDIKAYAQTTEPTVQNHLDMADAISAKMKGHALGHRYRHHKAS